jgi:hypothetical protein
MSHTQRRNGVWKIADGIESDERAAPQRIAILSKVRDGRMTMIVSAVSDHTLAG